MEKLKEYFTDIIIYKDPNRSKFFSSLGIPSYLRDWIIKKFSDENGNYEIDEIHDYIKKYIPTKNQWESIKAKMTNFRENIRILTKIRCEVDIKTGTALFSLPDLGFPSKKFEAVIDPRIIQAHTDVMFDQLETWGVIDLEWQVTKIGKSEQGTVVMVDFKPFRPYKVDLEYYQEVSKHFTFEEWIDVLLMAVDMNPDGFLSIDQKISYLMRLLPFVEKRLNLIELAPKGTGKSYLYSQISKYGWLVSGGSLTRAKLFYDLSQKAVGIIGRYDYIALDEIQSISFPDEDEMRGALKGYLESGEFRVGNYRGIADAGMVLLGNIDESLMDENKNMFRELPSLFNESALIDRFHGLIKGWNIPRMREALKAVGWAINSEYFSEILHSLRNDIRYRAFVDSILKIPKGADTRDTEAIKRLTTGFIKLFFPHIILSDYHENNIEKIREFCLKKAIEMRRTIRYQLHIMDREYSRDLPEITMD